MLHNDIKLTFLAFTGRTCSSHLLYSLSQHPDIEILDEQWAIKRFFDQHPEHDPDKHLVVKVPMNMLYSHNAFNNLFGNIICTWRRNKLDQMISSQLAKRDGFHETRYAGKVAIDIPWCENMMRICCESEAVMRGKFECTWFEYEEIANGDAIWRAQEIVGVNPLPGLRSGLSKQSNKPMIEYVENIDEVRNSPLKIWL